MPPKCPPYQIKIDTFDVKYIPYNSKVLKRFEENNVKYLTKCLKWKLSGH